jgi:polygalacturonase
MVTTKLERVDLSDFSIVKAETGSDITEELQLLIDSNSKVLIPQGEFYLSNTIKFSSNIELRGESQGLTRLYMSKGTNCNIFSNVNQREGGENITVSDLYINGNGSFQSRPEDQKKLSFCNAVYLANSKNLRFKNLTIEDCHQTALHFNNSDGVEIFNVITRNLGWSGLSTSGTSNIVATRFYVFDSGNDHRHSAIHLDGGHGVYLKCKVEKCVGNGVMLDSTFSPFSQAVVEAECSFCMRGLSLIGSAKSQPRSILIKNGKFRYNEIGVMVSNSESAFIDACDVEHNSQYGILFQGRVGGNNSVVSDCQFFDNKEDIGEIHESKNNKFFFNK